VARALDYDARVLVSVASAQTEPEAEMICARLADAGVPATTRRTGGADVPGLGSSGSRDIYVDEALAARASEVLAVPEFSDEELAELSEQAGRDAAPGASGFAADAP
jgi:hypothetical protein